MSTTTPRSKQLPIAASCCGPTEALTSGVRSAGAGDLARVQELIKGADLPVGGLPDQFGDNYAVAVEGARVIGAAGVERHGNFGLLRSVVVSINDRGRGIGEALVLDRIDWGMRAQIEAIYLLTTTAPDFFAQLGFQKVDRADAPAAIAQSGEFTSICPASATLMKLELRDGAALRGLVKRRYGAAAQRATTGEAAGCGCSTSDGERWDPITSNLYDQAEQSGVPAHAFLASLGCGNPTALAELKAGEVVLDLGSGGGIDVLLSAKRVGPTGKAYGLDMTDEMLALARENQRSAGATNVEFLKGEIENIPLPDNSVDVIISNCVINLSADKQRVINEAFRVLKPNGRFAVSDVVVRGDVPEKVRRSMELWVGCVAGALEETQYRQFLENAGFTNIDLEPTRVYQVDDARAFLGEAGIQDESLLAAVDGKVMSAFVRATKPCCGPGCCTDACAATKN